MLFNFNVTLTLHCLQITNAIAIFSNKLTHTVVNRYVQGHNVMVLV